MPSSLHETPPPDKPLLVYDGECGFCRRWIDRWRANAGDRIDYDAFQTAAERFPEIPRERFERAVVLIEPDGGVLSGAEAVFKALAYAPRRGWMLWAYRHLPGVASISERAYRLVADHRRGISKLTGLLWGRPVGRPSYYLTRWLFLRLLGFVYLIAFLSLATQIIGLAGASGISPAADYLELAEDRLGSEAYWKLPSLFWLDCSDATLRGCCLAGAGLSVLLIVGLAPAPVLLLLWALYLSLTTAGGVFLSFQWDILLLETGLLAVFFAPLRILPRLTREPPPSRIALWLLRWLLFRLMFLSGAVKLTSGDSTWWNLTALDYHYETQPLPVWTSWYAHQLPGWFQQVSVGIMFFLELGVPLLIFAPRRMRHLAAGGITLLMVLIGLTGNYNFFNLLTAVLCVTLLDDAAWRRFFPRGVGDWLNQPKQPARFGVAKGGLLLVMAGFIVTVSSLQGLSGTWGVRMPESVRRLLDPVSGFRSINAYGLFRVMTKTRPEIVIEGSHDGRTWLEYEFPWKPGELTRPPGFVQPHQPRLDWQMWFAALGDYRHPRNRWFLGLMSRVLEGSPEVLSLLEKNPFPEGPPRRLRARLYRYRFTDFGERGETGAWWKREFLRPYTPTLSRRADSPPAKAAKR